MNHLSLRTSILTVVAAVVAFAAAYSLSFTSVLPAAKVSAQAISLPAALEGFAWSSNIGWISMSCNNATQVRRDETNRTLGDDSVVSDHPNGTCASEGGYDYGVTIDTDGNLVGHAWSSNIGWIQFGGLSDFPTANGNPGGNARLVEVAGEYELHGWARVCNGTVPNDCSTMTSAGDGWDGWISLKGTADDGGTYRVQFVSGNVVNNGNNSFAWGDDVVGWINLSLVGVEPNPRIDWFTATPEEVELGDPVTLEWSIADMSSCAASNDRGEGDWSGAAASADGVHTRQVTPPIERTQYTIECVGMNGSRHTDTVGVLARPNIQITALSCTNCAADSLPTANPDGTYDGIRFTTTVTGIPSSGSAPYEFSFGGQSITGTLTSGNTTLQLDGVTPGTHSAVLEVDLPGPGTIAEDLPSTAGNEDNLWNRRTLDDVLISPAAPTMTIIADPNPIRFGEDTTISVTVTAPYIAFCRVDGNGITETFTTSGDHTVTYSDSFATPALESTTVYQLTCTEPTTNTDYTAEARVQVIPQVEEI